MQTRPFAYALAALALIGAGCSTTTTTTLPPTPEPGTTQEDAAVVPPVTPPEAPKDTSRDFGFIKTVVHEGGKAYIALDTAQLFTVDSADRAMHEDGKCSDEAYKVTGGCSPNGFYIRNKETSTQKLEVSATAQIVTLHYDPSGRYEARQASGLMELRDQKTVSFQEFEKIYAALDVPAGLPEHYIKIIPYHLTLKDGKVIKIDQQLTP